MATVGHALLVSVSLQSYSRNWRTMKMMKQQSLPSGEKSDGQLQSYSKDQKTM
jgi:hypothetical protein